MLQTELIPAAGERESRRLIIVLHGLGDSMDGYRWMPQALPFPWLNFLLVNAPDDYFGGYSWYDFDGDAARGIERSRRILFELLDQQDRNGFPTEQTVLFGFSQGCLMTWEVGLQYPRQLAGLVAISGYVHEPERLLKKKSPVALNQRILSTHGLMDPLIPFEPVQQQVETMKSAGLNVSWHEFAKEHTIAGEDELSVIRTFIRDCYPPAQRT